MNLSYSLITAFIGTLFTSCFQVVTLTVKFIFICLRCSGVGYSCQSSFPSSSCIRTSKCVGDGTCTFIMRPNGTICRSAVDVCDQPERYGLGKINQK